MDAFDILLVDIHQSSIANKCSSCPALTIEPYTV